MGEEELEQVAPTDEVWFCTMEEFLKNDLNHEHWFARYGFHSLSHLAEKAV
jgi:acetate kinase